MTKRLILAMVALLMIALPSLCSAQVSLSFSAPDLSLKQYSPIHFAVTASSSHPITAWRIYVDGTSAYSAGAVTSINAYVAMSAGTHSVVVRAWDSTGAYNSRAFTMTVSTTATPISLSFSAPDLSLKQYSPIHFAVTASSSNPITAWRIYVDGTSAYSAGAVTSINAYVAMSAGAHNVVVRAWDSTGAYDSRAFTMTVSTSSGSSGGTSGLNYYVNPAGSDSNDGSSAHPWRTIQHAANSVKPGATVHVAPGIYQEAITSNVSGTSTARIRFISDTKRDARIVSSGAFATWKNNGSYVDIVGFDITGTGNHQGIWTTASFGKILGNHVHDIAIPCDSNGGAGINAGSYTASDNLIDGNEVHDMGVWGTLCNGVHGIYLSQPNDVVSNNIVYQSTGSAINMYHDSAMSARIVNNTVFNSGALGPNGTCYGAGIAIGGATNNNTIIANNIVRDIHCWAILELDTVNGPNNKFMNNLLYNNYLSIHVKSGTVSGTITANPQFMNYVSTGGGDYSLVASSPAINRGTSTAAPKTDILGGARPTGSGYDIGAYEFDSSPATWPWF